MRLSDWCSPLLAVTLFQGGLDARAAEAAPPAEAALSYLKPVGPKKCEWVRQPLPSGEPSTLLAFDQPCHRAWIRWSADKRQGLIVMTAQADAKSASEDPAASRKKIPTYRLWAVDVAEKKSTPLDVQELLTTTARAAKGTDAPSLHGQGFDAQGRPVVLVSLVVSQDTINSQGAAFSFENKSHPLPDKNGWPGLALAYRWTGARWERFELKTTMYGEPGISVLKAAEVVLSASSSSRFDPLPGKPAAPALVKTLDKALKQDEAGHWMALPSPGATLVYWAQQCEEFNPEDGSPEFVARAPVRWAQKGVLSQVEQLPPSTDSDCVGFEFQLQGNWLALSARTAATQESLPAVHVYDTQTKKLLVSVPEAGNALVLP